VSLTDGENLGRFEIRGRLGAGGMGEVYRALDIVLSREVAIKVLPDRVAGDPTRLEQFQLEAQAVAALSHPNILEIHDVGEEVGVHYAVTELLEGETLRERIPTSGLPWQRVVEIGAAIADALAAAHAKGIVHRDLKPENVFITSTGRVKVLDFGLARLQELAPPDSPSGVSVGSDTKTSPVYGTVGYLAPEVIEGAGADPRSDIFALGCVLYEMVSGRRAFRRDSAPETLWASLREEPPRPSSLGAMLPRELEDTIARCLEKSPEARFQSAADLAFALRAISGSASVSPVRLASAVKRRRWGAIVAVTAIAVAITIAAVVWGPRLLRPSGEAVSGLDPNRVVVVPFDNRTGDPGYDVVGLMAADWLNQGISQVGELKVIANSSAVAAARLAADAPSPPLEVARLVGAETIVAGAYYLQNATLQIKAEVFNAATGELVHEVEPVSGPASEPMAAVESLRQQVLRLLTARDPIIGKFTPPNFEAYREYLAGGGIFLEDPERGFEHFQRAVELDPDFYPARIMSVVALNQMQRFDESLALFEEIQQSRDQLSSYERLNLDTVRLYSEQRYIEALPLARELVTQDPLNPIARNLHSEVAIWTNHPQESLESLEALDVWTTADWVRLGHLCQALHMLGRHERELEVARQAVADFPRYRVMSGLVARALGALGRTEELAELVDQTFPDATALHAWLAFEASVELRAHGSPAAAREIAERALESLQGAPIREPAVQPWPGNFGNPVSPVGFADPPVEFWLGHLMVIAERPEDALALFNELASTDDPFFLLRSSAAQVAAMLGDRETAMAFSRLTERLERPEWFGGGAFMRAFIAAGLGEHDEAVELMHAALRDGFRFGPVFHRTPFLEPLHDHEGFKEFLRPKG
jgi:tetratricopeptide (TPR) repeat protein